MDAEITRKPLFGSVLMLALGLMLLPAEAADPMQPPQWQVAAPVAPAPEKPLALQQISIRSNDALAVINGRIVRVGDRVDGATVTAIFPASVRVKIRQKERELSLISNTRHFSE